MLFDVIDYAICDGAFIHVFDENSIEIVGVDVTCLWSAGDFAVGVANDPLCNREQETDGNAVWTEIHDPVEVMDGEFTVILGTVASAKA